MEAVPKPRGSNFWMYFLIFLIAAGAVGAIVYIQSRAKCVIPTDKQCDDGQAWICKSDDADPVCDTWQNVCGSVPSDFTSIKCGTVDCQYDPAQKKYAWACNGTGRDGRGDIPVTQCVKTGTSLNYSTVVTGDDGSYKIQGTNTTVAKYSDVYNYMDFGDSKGCLLSSCSDSTNYKLLQESGICVPSEHGTTITMSACETIKNPYPSDANTHDYTDVNSLWQVMYGPPLNYGDEPIKYCAFQSCNTDTPRNFDPTTKKCEVASSGGNCAKLTDKDNHILQWGYDSGAKSGSGCFVAKCDGSDYKVSPDKQSCQKICSPSKIYTFDTDCNRIGCIDTKNYTWDPTGKTCTPNCRDPDVLRSYIFPSGMTPVGDYTYTGENFHNTDPSVAGTDNEYICIPTQSDMTNYYGGCGDDTHPEYALNDKPGNATYCTPTIAGNTSKFSYGSDGSDAGCLLCKPRNCPSWATSLDQCIGDVEAECYYTSGYNAKDVDGTIEVLPLTPIQACLTEQKGKNPSLWSIWGDITTSATLNDNATYVVGGKPSRTEKRTTVGAPYKPSDGTGITLYVYGVNQMKVYYPPDTLISDGAYTYKIVDPIVIQNWGPNSPSLFLRPYYYTGGMMGNEYECDASYYIRSSTIWSQILKNLPISNLQEQTNIKLTIQYDMQFSSCKPVCTVFAAGEKTYDTSVVLEAGN